jgi:MFS family permease
MMIELAGSPALVPSLVSAEHLETANALETLSYTLGGVVGPVIAGLLIARIGAPNVVLIDALSYFFFAFMLYQIPAPSKSDDEAGGERPRYHLGHAVQLLLKNPILLSTTLMFLVFNIGGGGILSVWLPIMADRTLNGGAELYGTLLGILACGEVLGALLAGSAALPFTLGARICMAQLLAGLSLLFLLITPDLWLVAAGLFGFGLFSAPLTIWAQTLRMQIIPADLRGRTFALLRMLMQSGNPIGGALGGWLLPLLGIPFMIGVSSVLAGLPGLLGYGVRALRMAGSTRTENPAPVPPSQT